MLNWLLEGLRLAVDEGIDYRARPDATRAVERNSCHLFDFADEVGLVEDKNGMLEHRTVWSLLWNWYQDQKILHVDEKGGRPTWNDRDMQGDKPVRIPRDLERRLRSVFPRLKSEKQPVTKATVLIGVALGGSK
jgi:putative DNA primase/helicase